MHNLLNYKNIVLDLSAIDNALCSLEISIGSQGFRRLAKTFEIILYIKLHKLIGRNWSNLSGFWILGIRVMDVLLISGGITAVVKNC